MTSCAFRHYNESVLFEDLWPPAVRPTKGERLMENKSLRFYAIMALWVVLFVLLFVSNRRVDLKTDINKSTSVSVSVEDTVSLSPSVVTTRAYSADDDTYQAFFEILQKRELLPKIQPECPLLLPRLRSAFHHPALCRRCQPEPAFHRLFRRGLPGKRKIRLPPLPRWKRRGDLPAAAGCGGVKNVVRSPGCG